MSVRSGRPGISESPGVARRSPETARWRVWLLAGFLPSSLLGFGASAVADRPIFLLWWAVASAIHAWAVRRSFRARGSAPGTPPRAGLPLAAFGASLVLFGLLSWIYRGDLGEGIAAVMPVGSG